MIQSHAQEGHLLPRGLDELRQHADRFVVCDVAGADHGLRRTGAVVAPGLRGAFARRLRDFRRVGLAARLVDELRRRARASGFETLCAFTHDPRFFVRQNFSIVPHLWLPEKISTDCVTCPLFRKCEQYAMALTLADVARFSAPAEVRRFHVA